jgi:hypothetical protein
VSCYLGVDPGKEGGIAAVDPEGALLWVRPTPMVEGPRADYDLPGIAAVLREAAPRFVLVEKAQPLPPMGFGAGGKSVGGSAANFARGLAHGWAWMLTALGIPFDMVAPQTWQKVMLGERGTDTGQRSILSAQQRWPLADFKRSARCRTLSDGMTDAALLADFGRRRQQAAPPA